MTDDRISGSLQENLLTLLCFDDKNCKLARAAVTPQLFESSVFREIAGHAIDFIDQYGEAIKDHLPDHLEGILNGDDHRKAASYKKLLDSLFLNRESINSDFVVSQLQKFVRQQNYKAAVVNIAEALEDGRVDDAELAMQKALKNQVSVFSPGLNLSDAKQVVGLLDDMEEPGFNMGIKPFDDLGVIPRRKELMMFLAPRGKGKSWFCVHVAKWALLQRWSVLVVTLEMSQKRYAARFLQSFFSISKRESEVRVAKLVTGRDGSLQDVLFESVERMTLKDPNIVSFLSSRVKREFRKRPPLIIKEFPTQALTMPQLEAYLESLERHEGIVPDLIVVDYPDLMKHDPKNKRIEIGMIVEQLRGIAVARNCAMVVPTQSNREGESATTVTTDQASEDISKIATADVVITYSQTPEEHRLGLARLLAGKARNDHDKFSALITQAYAMGQFCLDAVMLQAHDYWPILEDKAPKRKGRRDDDTKD